MQPQIIGCIFVLGILMRSKQHPGLLKLLKNLVGRVHEHLDGRGVGVVAVAQNIYGSVGYRKSRSTLPHRSASAYPCSDAARYKCPLAAF